MCAGADEVERSALHFVYEQPVAFKMAFAVTGPLSMKGVIAVGRREGHFVGQHFHDGIEVS